MANGWPSLSDTRESRAAEPTPISYGRAIRAHVFLVLVVTAATVVSSIVAFEARTPEYRAEAELVVTPLPVDDLSFLRIPLIRESGDATRTIQTAAALVDSPEAAERAAALLPGDWSPSRVAASVDVEPKGQTNILAVTATAATGRDAAAVANAFAEAVVSGRGEVTAARAGEAIPLVRARLRALRRTNPAAVDLERLVSRLETLQGSGDPTVSIGEGAVVPSEPAGQSLSLIIVLALLAGTVVGIGAALLREYTEGDAIHDEHDLMRVLPLPVLGRLPKAQRSPLGPEGPQLPHSVRATCRSIRTQLELVPNPGRTVVFAAATSADRGSYAAGSFALTLALDGGRVRLATSEGSRTLGDAMEVPTAQVADARLASTGSRGNGESAPAAAAASTGSAGRVPGVPLLDLCELPDSLEQAGSRSKRTRGSLDGAHAEFFVVDAPPLLEATRALPYLGQADDIVLVVRLKRTTVTHLERVRGLLSRAGVVPAGYVVVEA